MNNRLLFVCVGGQRHSVSNYCELEKFLLETVSSELTVDICESSRVTQKLELTECFVGGFEESSESRWLVKRKSFADEPQNLALVRNCDSGEFVKCTCNGHLAGVRTATLLNTQEVVQTIECLDQSRPLQGWEWRNDISVLIPYNDYVDLRGLTE